MRVEKLFQVLVVVGASSTVGLAGCGGSDEGDDDSDSTGGQPGAGGSSSGGMMGGDSCDDVCGPSTANASWTDCNGCCCWLPEGASTPSGSPICGDEPCCEGRGR